LAAAAVGRGCATNGNGRTVIVTEAMGGGGTSCCGSCCCAGDETQYRYLATTDLSASRGSFNRAKVETRLTDGLAA